MKSYTIYMHISPNNKRYIGITSQDIKKRWNDGYGYKTQKYFYRAIEKYGWDNFQHIIVAKGLTEDEAKWLEVELIKEWDTTNREKGYNLSRGGDGANPTLETRQKLSESKMGENNPMHGKTGEKHHNWGKHHSEETKKKRQETWNNKTEEELNEWRKKISNSLIGEKNPRYGKHHTQEAIDKISKANKGKKRTEEQRRKNSEAKRGEKNPNAVSVICITTEKTFKTAKEASDYYDIDSSAIIKCCKGMKKYSYVGKLNDDVKLVWMYLDDYEKATENEIQERINKAYKLKTKKIICITTKKIFNNMEDASKFYNIEKTGIGKCCQGKRKYSGSLPNGEKLTWKYLDDYLKEGGVINGE